MTPAPSLLPSVAVLEMTYRCNHACQFCSCPWFGSQMATQPELELAEWRELIAAFGAAGVTHFTFTGGEALLKEGLAELLEFAARTPVACGEADHGQMQLQETRPTLNLLTNGRLLTDDWLQLCARLHIHLSISLPGLRHFAANTASDTDPGRILEHFARARALAVVTTVGIAVTKRNLPELYETIAAALLAGADTLLLNRFLPGGRGLSHPELCLSSAEVVEAARIAETCLARAGRYGHFGTELPRCLIDPGEFHYLTISTGCAAARTFFTVGPNGKLRVCNHSPVELTSWRNFRQLGQHPVWMSYIAGSNLPEMCRGCDHTGACAGGCREAARVVHGRVDAPDPVFSLKEQR